MRFLSEAEQGIEVDDYEGIHPDILTRYYGIEDAENDDRELDDDEVLGDLQQNIAQDMHDTVEVVPNKCPFESMAILDKFKCALAQVNAEGIALVGFGVQEEELEDMPYPVKESFSAGQRRSKTITISLPTAIWYSQAVMMPSTGSSFGNPGSSYLLGSLINLIF